VVVTSTVYGTGITPARTLAAQGDYPAARAMQEDVLARRRRVFGEDHPATILAAANLAATLTAQGDYPAARTMQEDVLAWRRRVLGEDHPATIRAKAALAELDTTWPPTRRGPCSGV
jgi:hypothetical protein